MGRPLTRVVLWWLLVGAWLVAVWYMWDATVTVPSAGRLEESRQVAIPTVRTFWAAVAFSGLELAVILATLWPWRPELYATRMAAAVLALVTWFVITTPLDITRLDWVHRRWLLAMAAGILLALALLLAGRALDRFRSAPDPH